MTAGAAGRLGRLAALALLTAWPLHADKGHLWPRPVALREEAQRAILLHNGTEEVLILGIEVSAGTPVEILEFIPFPSEPSVAVAPGEPFRAIQALATEKRLVVPTGRIVKGRPALAPVEVRSRATVGLHDITVLQLREAGALAAWVEAEARKRMQPVPANLAAAVQVAGEYVRSGYPFLVLDRVRVGAEPRLVQPLAYRFKSPRVYYPLRTSNLVGGAGEVMALMVLPGTFPLDGSSARVARVWKSLQGLSGQADEVWRLGSSAKVQPAELARVWPDAPAFFRGVPKLYVQALCYQGAYRFTADLSLDPADLVPYACKLGPGFEPESYRFDLFTDDEIQDYCDANPDDPYSKAWLEAMRSRRGKEPDGRR